MKLLAVVFAALLASVAAKSEQELQFERKINERFVDGILAEALENVSNQIRENGLDPFYTTDVLYQRLPVTDLLVLRAEVEDLLLVGLSNIVLNRASFNYLTFRLTFEISLPMISLNVASSSVDLTFFGYNAAASLKGSLDVQDIRVSGVASVSLVGAITGGVAVRSIDVDFTLGGVRSDLEVSVLGSDLSGSVNQLARSTIPQAIAANRNDINTLLEHYIMAFLSE